MTYAVALRFQHPNGVDMDGMANDHYPVRLRRACRLRRFSDRPPPV